MVWVLLRNESALSGAAWLPEFTQCRPNSLFRLSQPSLETWFSPESKYCGTVCRIGPHLLHQAEAPPEFPRSWAHSGRPPARGDELTKNLSFSAIGASVLLAPRSLLNDLSLCGSCRQASVGVWHQNLQGIAQVCGLA